MSGPIKTIRTIRPLTRHISLQRNLPTNTTPVTQRFYSSVVEHSDDTDDTDDTDEHPSLNIKKPPPRSILSKNVSWSKEVDDSIVALRAQKTTWPRISQILKRPQSAIADRYYTLLDPDLKTWTPAMFAQLDQMAENGEHWARIAAVLNKRVITCRYQWQTLGKGRYRVKGFLSSMQNMTWEPQEIENFWDAWLKFGNMDWERIAKSVKSRTERECQNAFRALVVKSLQDASGWVKLEAFIYITETNRKARSRITKGVETDELEPNPTVEEDKWTDEEHKALLKAVEVHGLFSAWTEIRKQVKPNLTNTQVENEYYRLSGAATENDLANGSGDDDDGDGDKEMHQYTRWTKDEFEGLNLILMKYSDLRIWVEEAKKRNIKASEDDYEKLFRKSRKKDYKHVTERPLKKSKKKDQESAVEQIPDINNNDNDNDNGNDSSNNDDDINNTSNGWNGDRIRRLKRLVSQQQQQQKATSEPINWQWIADHIGPGFEPAMCQSQWETLPGSDIVKYVPSKFWDVKEVEILEKGLSKYGKAWTLIHKNLLPQRSSESIRRKVTNIQTKRDKLVEVKTTEALILRQYNPKLDVDKFVQTSLKDDSYFIQATRFDAVIQAHVDAGRKLKK
ncbi:hypothetical protein BGZ76_002687 [Entomortierella beljakovae]|nr:hypothetical protein BGZ76_002687 [Entomortierella beljakovae]